MACKCKNIGNTGYVFSETLQNPKKLIFTDFLKADGEINEINLAVTTFDKAFFIGTDSPLVRGKVNLLDLKERWLPTSEAYEIKIEPADPQIQTLSDNSTNYLRDGIITVTAMFNKMHPKFKGIFDKLRCGNKGIYLVDLCDNLVGDEINKEFLAPWHIDENSVSVKWMPETNEAGSMLELKFNLHKDFKVERMAIVTAEQMEYNVSLINGLLNVDAEEIVISPTTIEMDLATDWGTPLDPILDEGRVTVDFVSIVGGATGQIYNEDTPGNVPVTVLESTTKKGHYTLTFAAQIPGDILKVKVVKNGRDYTAIETREFIAV